MSKRLATLGQIDHRALLKNLEASRHTAKVHTSALNVGRVSVDAAKVHTVSHKKVETSAFRVEVGQCIERARCLAGLTADQFADVVGCDPAQLSKWIRNVEPPQLDRVLMSPMRGYMLEALAERTPGCEVEAVIRMRRHA